MDTHKIIGRDQELDKIKLAYRSPGPEFMAIVGRRRIGKTYLVNAFFKQNFDFEITAIQTGNQDLQLQNFAKKIDQYSSQKTPIPQLTNWLEAFDWLKIVLKQKRTTRKKTIFIDELPWFDTPRSGFVEAFAHFWNDWASKNYVFVIVCGSATSWMTTHLINNKGGLHNRITSIIHLQPFTLTEVHQFLRSRLMDWDAYQLALIYMTLGGVPHYLKEIKKEWSAAQNIDHICFNPKSTLANEFQNLYHSLFSNASAYIDIIKVLSKKWQGMTRKGIVTQLGAKDGGSITRIIQDLLSSGLILENRPFNKAKKDTIYRLIDPYSLFYLKFIDTKQHPDFLSAMGSPQWKAWSGYAFENIWFTHINEIKRNLGISALRTSVSSFISKGNSEQDGFQIDLLLDRADHCVNICEAKFYNQPLKIDKSSALHLKKRINRFRETTHTKKHIFLTLLTVYGIEPSPQTLGLIDQVVAIEDFIE